jgi:uncharacterized membrane protein YcgQ (UPF0703/DUF1980 family)
MIVPVILFMLGLPNKGPSAGSFEGNVDPVPANVSFDQSDAEAYPVDFRRLVGSANDPSERDYLRGKTVSLLGQIVINPQDRRYFEIVRFKIQCCAGDATPLRVLCFSKEPVGEFKRDSWADVTAKVDYVQRGQDHFVRLLVANANKVKPSPPDLNPYVQ